MKLGVVARAEDRGLGNMLWEFCRNMDPDRVLVVDLGALAGGYPMHLDRYPGADVVPFDGWVMPEAETRAWLRGLDVVYVAETWYDDRFPEWAAAEGVRVVAHVMPEFYRWTVPPAGVTWWAPTTWRLDTLPASTRVVPVPVALDRFPTPDRGDDGRLRVLHVAGKLAAADRNGTSIVLGALGRVREPIDVTLAAQGPTAQVRVSGSVKLTKAGPTPNYWDLYAGHDVLVMPRRYGGLSLPIQEAAGAGLGLVLTDTAPNPATWPCIRIRVRNRTTLAAPAGTLDVANADPGDLAGILDHLARRPPGLGYLQDRARAWAEAHSWTALRGEYRSLLAAACD